MKKIILFGFFLCLFTSNSFAQCGKNQVELRVKVTTDNFGSETSWKLTDQDENIILQGGQGGVYANNTTYSESTCVDDNGCFFFEIFDSYGDGINVPNAYKIYVDGILVAKSEENFSIYESVKAYCPNSSSITFNALNDLKSHINGTATLSKDELSKVKNIFQKVPESLVENETNLLLAKTVINDYDSKFGALFTTAKTKNGIPKKTSEAPGLEFERAMIALEQGVFDHVFTPEVYNNYPQHINGWIFNSCNAFPGHVDPPANPSESHSVSIRANFADPEGANPYFKINNDNTEHALRPTGLYLAPGSIATITVPQSLVGKDYYVRVGSHEWDLGIRGHFHRLDRISKKFLISSKTIEVYNPFGGAISILVPYGADAGIVEVSIKNGVQCPFISMKSFYETPDFNAEFSKPGPWAVFETDNVMFTIPSHSVIPGQYDIKKALQDWDKALQGVNYVMDREIVSDKHNMYMIADITIRHHAYSIGYPMSNTHLEFTNVPGPTYFLNGPGPDDETNFHESGHALAMTKFPGEEEALVNFPYIMAMNYGLGQDLNEAVKYSFVPNTYDMDKTATHRMVSKTFGTERDISNTTLDEVRYQHRGYGHYFEMVNMFGWCPIKNFWKQEYIDFENGIDYGIYQDIDNRILRMSIAAQQDLRPLFHVFGIVPQNANALQKSFNSNKIKPSVTIYNRLQDYFDLIPKDNAAFVDYALDVYPNLYQDGPNDSPDYGVGWHYQKSLTYNAAEAKQRTQTLQGIIDLYFPNGKPEDNSNIGSIGNRVWNDLNRNGINEPNEPGIAGVSVVLWSDPDGDGNPDAFSGVEITDANGYYKFTGLAPGKYLLFVWCLNNWEEGKPLHGFVSTNGFVANANNDVDLDNNGYGPAGTDIKSGIVTLTLGGEPLSDGGEADCFLNSAGNNTVDFGFYNPNHNPNPDDSGLFPYSEGFENGIGTWTQDSNDDFDWTVHKNKTPTERTGPNSAYEGTYYLYTESSSPNSPNKKAIFNSPNFDLTTESSASFNFEYHMYGKQMGTLELQASTNGTNWTTIWKKSGNNKRSWHTANLNLSSYCGSSVQLRYVATTGQGGKSDFAIDNISFTNGSTPTVNNLKLTIVFDKFPEDIDWTIKNSGGSVVASGGNYGPENKETTLVIPINDLSDGCYDFTITDSFGDGLCCAHGSGSYKLEATGGATIKEGGEFGSSESINFCLPATTFTLGAVETRSEEVRTEQTINLYPNPANSYINVKFANGTPNGVINIYNSTGALVKVIDIENGEQEVDISNFLSGLYLISVETRKEVLTKQFIKK